MSTLNFFADLDVLNCLLGMQYDVKAKPAMDLTVDFQDLPFWFSLKSDRNSQTLTIYKQMELYSKDEKMAMFTARWTTRPDRPRSRHRRDWVTTWPPSTSPAGI